MVAPASQYAGAITRIRSHFLVSPYHLTTGGERSTMPVSRESILAGDAVFTVVLPPKLAADHAAGYSYRVVETTFDDGSVYHFVHFLADDGRWVYAGKLDTYLAQLVPTSATKWPSTSMRWRLFNRLLPRIWCDDEAAWTSHGFEVFEGQPVPCPCGDANCPSPGVAGACGHMLESDVFASCS